MRIAASHHVHDRTSESGDNLDVARPHGITVGKLGFVIPSFFYKLQHLFRVLYLAIVLFPIGSKRSATSSASRLFLGMGGGGDITVVAADDDDVPVERTAIQDALVKIFYLYHSNAPSLVEFVNERAADYECVRPRTVNGDGAAHCDDVHEGERRRRRLESGEDERSRGAPAVLVRRRLPCARVDPGRDLLI